MTMQKKQARYLGIALIVIGVVAFAHLWWLLPAVLLAAGGITIYRRQKAIGRNGEAVQAALWGLGLAVLLLLDALFPGVLLLGGASLLLRGREAEAEARVLAMVGRLSRRSSAAQTMHAPRQSVTIVDAQYQTSGSETIRL